MLSLQLQTGEYMTIGEDVVVQLNRISGNRCKLMVHAPRDMTILRGEVRERTGGERPGCVLDAPPHYRQEIYWNRKRSQALSEMRALLRDMDGGDSNVRALRRQLDSIFPPDFASDGAARSSN